MILAFLILAAALVAAPMVAAYPRPIPTRTPWGLAVAGKDGRITFV
jgi:hypothetical protein